MNAIIDWFQFTFKNELSPATIIQEILCLNLDNFTELQKGNLGYKKQLFNSNISILYDGNDDMGVHIIMTGQGCRFYENFRSMESLISQVHLLGGKSTRIDIAIDDKVGKYIFLDKIIDDTIQGNLTSRWKTSMEITKRNIQDTTITGKSIAYGSRASDIYLRIYDKAQESETDGFWNRLELEVKKDRAVELQRIIAENEFSIGNVAVKILNNYIRFLEPNKTDLNKSRWKTADYWLNFIKTTEKLKLTTSGEVRTLEDIKKWINNQVSPSLATIVKSEGGSIDFIIEEIKNGIQRMNEKQKDIVRSEEQKNV